MHWLSRRIILSASVWRRSSGCGRISRATLGSDPRSENLRPVLADTYGALALILEDAGRRDEARAAYRRSCQIGEALFRANPEDPKTGHDWQDPSGTWRLS